MIRKKVLGMNVMHRKSHMIGKIINIVNDVIVVDFHGKLSKYIFPAAFSEELELEDENVQSELEDISAESNFDIFKKQYLNVINTEIQYLKNSGGRIYRLIDGVKISSQNGEYVYAFDTDTELHFTENTPIKLRLSDAIISAYIISCEDYSIVIRTTKFLGNKVISLEFTAEQWQLLEALMQRVKELQPCTNSIAYEVACRGRYKVDERKNIVCGQKFALKKSQEESITFIWGPPGTGKTYTLAKIALEFIEQGKRVLMLSYSNVSVDGALLKVAKMSDCTPGQILRYGYPRVKELLESKTLTSYQFVLKSNEVLSEEFYKLNLEKKALKKKDVKCIEINKRLHKIRETLLNEERKLIQSATFIATTVSKAIIDSSIYEQKFDLVIFDEASMAYIPQVVFAASLASSNFVCLGDFRQLPAIVQSNTESALAKDIFEHTGVTIAVDNDYGHEWLVMLNTQYRMHRDIADFIGELMYGGRLETSNKIDLGRQQISNCEPMSSEPMSLLDLSYTYSVCTKTMDGSRINLLSAIVSVRIAELCIEKYNVGIVTPYNAQSRLIVAMIRDLAEQEEKFSRITCATVHQFQGSERPIIIYDAVDCLRMPYPGTLLTSLKGNTANRLFNVALTRAQGKFILVCNRDYMFRKNISKQLIFTKALENMYNSNAYLDGEDAIDALYSDNIDEAHIVVSDRENSWTSYIEDIRAAKQEIYIDIPGVIDENDQAFNELATSLEKLESEEVKILIRKDASITLPTKLEKYVVSYPYVINPVTIIDKNIVWYGQPLSAADFRTEGETIETQFFICARFRGAYTARLLQAFLEL